MERRVPELRGMDAGWRGLPSLVLKGSSQSDPGFLILRVTLAFATWTLLNVIGVIRSTALSGRGCRLKSAFQAVLAVK
ncbi:MAG: hypothetical protein OXE58_13400, partial [Acidobacteria bacterium]|nr:hypothetical protein [Acidobacteriota bacterium]